MNNIKSIDIRFEGDVNTNWDLHYNDGSCKSYYSIDGDGPLSCGDDSDVYSSNPELYSLLLILQQLIGSQYDLNTKVVDITGLTYDGCYISSTKVKEETY